MYIYGIHIIYEIIISLFSFIARALFTVLYYVDVSLFYDYIGMKKLFRLFLFTWIPLKLRLIQKTLIFFLLTLA